MRAKTEMKVSKTQILRRHTRHTLMPVANLPTFVLLVGFTQLWLLDPMQLRVQVDPSTQGHQAAEEDRRARARVRAELEEKGRAADMQVLLDQKAMERSNIEANLRCPYLHASCVDDLDTHLLSALILNKLAQAQLHRRHLRRDPRRTNLQTWSLTRPIMQRTASLRWDLTDGLASKMAVLAAWCAAMRLS